MLMNARSEREDSAIKVPYSAITLDEALYLLDNYFEGHFDAGKKSVILNE